MEKNLYAFCFSKRRSIFSRHNKRNLGVMLKIELVNLNFLLIFIYADMVESEDTRDLKSLGSNTVPVQIWFSAPVFYLI